MIKIKRNLDKFQFNKLKESTELILILILTILSIFLIYDKSLPKQFDLKPGDTVMFDITSDREIIDKKATAKRAKEQEIAVQKVMTRSAQLSNQYLSVLEEYLTDIENIRESIKVNPLSLKGSEISQNDLLENETEPFISQISKENDNYLNDKFQDSTSILGTLRDKDSTEVTLNYKENTDDKFLNTPEAIKQENFNSNQDNLLNDVKNNKSDINNINTSAQLSTIEDKNLQEENSEYILNFQQKEELAQRIKEISLDKYNFAISDSTVTMILDMPYSIFKNYIEASQDSAKRILLESLDHKNINNKISNEIANLVDTLPNYKDEFKSISEILKHFIFPNVEFDERATRLAKEATIAQVNSNPIMVPKGTRIVNVGDILSDEQYKYLEELNLLHTGSINYNNLAGILLVCLEFLFFSIIYIKNFAESIWKRNKSLLAIMLTAFITILASYYIADFSPYAVIIPFFAIILSNFYGFKTAFVLSSILSITISLMKFNDIGFLISNILLAFSSASSLSYGKHGTNYLKVILYSFIPNIPIIVCVSLIRDLSSQEIVNALIIGTLTAALAAMAAIGFTPIIEVLESKVSPMKLTNLSHPGNTLLRRLFFEAPGTNQHSMMVATLAEAGAEAIGADSLFCRVASYYHDIGKLANPIMFTENQDGYNPHDNMTAQESFKAIVNHVEEGLSIGKRYRLPEPILDIIREHHGTTVLFYFYNKAVKQAEEEGKSLPSLEEFRYPYIIPQSKESGIIMLADTVEAAVKSMQLKSTVEVRKLARKLLRQKNEQEQLIESKLSYDEVEKILLAFERVYQGQMHERVRYPEPHKNIKLHE